MKKFSVTFCFYVFKTKWSNLIRIPDWTERMHIVFFSSPSHHLASINYPTPRSSSTPSWQQSGLVCCLFLFFFIRHFCRKFSTVVNMSEGQRCKICTRSKKADRSPLLPFHSCVEIPSASLKQGLDTMETRNLWRQTLKRIRRFLLNVVEK